jgi:hypothetical protein
MTRSLAAVSVFAALFLGCATTAPVPQDPTEPQSAWGAPTGHEVATQSFGSRLVADDFVPDRDPFPLFGPASSSDSCAFNSQCPGGSCRFGACSPFPPANTGGAGSSCTFGSNCQGGICHGINCH